MSTSVGTHSSCSFPQEDLSAAGWKRHLEHKAASAPLSEREEEAKLVKKLEGMRTEGSAVRSGDLPNTVGTPWTEDAEQAVAEFASSSSKALYLVRSTRRKSNRNAHSILDNGRT